MMHHFIGTKIIKARPMTRGEYNSYRGWEIPTDENPDDVGYLVEYTDGGQVNHPAHVGYISWSPKEVFDKAYVGMDTDFGTTEVPAHLLRLSGERAELADRLEKLKTFIDLQTAHHNNDEDLDDSIREKIKHVPKLEQAEWRMLMEQSMIMASLLTILDRRLRSAKEQLSRTLGSSHA